MLMNPISSIVAQPGARPTNDITTEFEIRPSVKYT